MHVWFVEEQKQVSHCDIEPRLLLANGSFFTISRCTILLYGKTRSPIFRAKTTTTIYEDCTCRHSFFLLLLRLFGVGSGNPTTFFNVAIIQNHRLGFLLSNDYQLIIIIIDIFSILFLSFQQHDSNRENQFDLMDRAKRSNGTCRCQQVKKFSLRQWIYLLNNFMVKQALKMRFRFILLPFFKYLSYEALDVLSKCSNDIFRTNYFSFLVSKHWIYIS